jgi:protein ImuB
MARPATAPATPTTPPRSAGGAAAPSPRSADGDARADAPHWDERPLAIAEGDAGPARRLRVVSAHAGRLGVRAGMTVASARARCAALEVWPWDEDAVRRAIDAVSALLLVASPQVTPVAGGPGLWWVGAGGLDGVGGERGLARALHRLAGAWHPGARVGVADSCVAARAATWDYGPPEPVVDPYAAVYAAYLPPDPPGRPAPPAAPRGCVVVPRGGCAGYLATVPLALVQMDAEVRAGLAALGVRTAGGLAALDAGDVEARWGPAGLSAWQLARGVDRRRPGLVRVEARRSVSTELAAPSTTVEPVLFLVRAALDRLVADLARDALGAAAVALTLHLDVGATRTITREVRLPRPQARVAPLFERCRALLERAALPAPVCGVTVSVPATGRLGSDQGDLLSPAWHDPAAVEAAFARIRAELGPNVVVRAVARDHHRPERAGQWLPVDGVDAPPEPAPEPPPTPVPTPDPAALRLLEPAESAAVEPDGAGAPATVHWRGRALAVTRADGPERLSGEWWADPYRRDYWRCTTAAGLLLTYRDRRAGGWWVQGWYD